ncbi:AzlD family protein [Zavarzinia sp. CC-PAN008]|uniref:AzlD family protein n=1 Tax=Zavarzinia sp. CC-PAN008 TaxID=3243332 RepID=UPI003F748E60
MSVDPTMPDLSVDASTLAAIAGMAAATYAVRIGGFAIISRVRPSRFVEAWLPHIPGAMFMALVAPSIVHGGLPFWAAAAVVILVGRASRSLLPTLVVAAAVAAFIRHMGWA